MWGRWRLARFSPNNILYIVLMLLVQRDTCLSLNFEGLALMEFRLKVGKDPNGIFDSWNPDNDDPCSWQGVHCVCGKVTMLNLNGLSLGGTLASEIGKLNNLKSLVLSNNNFSGTIPKEIGGLTQLELLDLRSNNFSGKIPEEMIALPSLKYLWLCNNRFEDDGHLQSMVDEHSSSQCEVDSSYSRFKYRKNLPHFADNVHNNIKSLSDPYLVENEDHEFISNLRRRLLEETHNLAALPIDNAPILDFVDIPSTASGAFPAVTTKDDKSQTSTTHMDPLLIDPPVTQSPPPDRVADPTQSNSLSKDGLSLWMYILVAMGLVLLLLFVVAIILKSRSHTEGTVSPWKTGISCQLQKAFVAGVPKLNRGELEAACEDFSNIIESYPECTVYKGTLSSGVEIAVCSTVISSATDWSEHSETSFHKKVDLLSRVNHKNFVNLLGYCEENEPFMRMMVFEYAPNGTLFEHLHVKELEHLDWSARMRIIMGIAYCLQYMHHELNPPVALANVESSIVLMTDDYAAKIMEMDFWKDFTKGKMPMENEASSLATPSADFSGNVYKFGILMLEVISGKPPHKKEQGTIAKWATELLKEKQSAQGLVDPTLQSVKSNELETVYQVILECINQDQTSRPTMKDITTKLREGLGISPESATPRLSPLWWAELEILSVEAS